MFRKSDYLLDMSLFRFGMVIDYDIPEKRNDMKQNITALTVKNLLTVLVALTLTITASAQTRAAKVVNGDGLLIDAVQEYENGNWKKHRRFWMK